MAVVDLSSIIVAYKVQAGLGTPATGAGATGLEVLPSQGMTRNVNTIESALIKSNRMKKRPRHGSVNCVAAYQTELVVGALDDYFEMVLGGTWAATFDVDEGDVTSMTISGTGVTLTSASGSFITLGIRAGMMGKFADLSEAGNNGVWFPILNVTATVLTIPSGFLEDNATDSAFTLTVARSLSTTDPYTKRYVTLEEYWGSDQDQGKLGTDMYWNELSFDAQVDSPITIGMGAGGRDLEPVDTGDAPNFTSPTFVSGNSVVLLDGGLYMNGTKRANITGFQFSLTAPVTNPGVIGTRVSPDTFLGQFAFSGTMTVMIEDLADFQASINETVQSAVLHCAENEADPADFITFYLGNLTFGSFQSPSGGEGPAIATIPIYGGDDDRGSGFAETTVVISTSAA